MATKTLVGDQTAESAGRFSSPAGTSGAAGWSVMEAGGSTVAAAGTASPGPISTNAGQGAAGQGFAGITAIGGAGGTSGVSDIGGPCQGLSNGAVCDGGVMYHCNGSSTAQEVCTSSALCQIGLAAGKCAVCNPGAFSCDGASLSACSDTGQLAFKQTCASVALCNTSVGACTDMVCTPNAKSCSADGTLQNCSGDGASFTSSEPCGANLCDATNGRCYHCQPNSKQCSGSSLIVCSSDGQTMTPMSCTAQSDCYSATCAPNGCQQVPKPASSACSSGVCDGAGNCVACLSDANCSAGQMCDVQRRACKSKPCGDGLIDAAAGETCDPMNPAFMSKTYLCDANCHVVDALWRERCATAQGGSEAWPGSASAGFICSGQDTTSKLCSSQADCPGSAAQCISYYDPNDNALRACGIACTPAAFDQPVIKSTCLGSTMCFPVLGQGAMGQLGGTCGYEAI